MREEEKRREEGREGERQTDLFLQRLVVLLQRGAALQGLGQLFPEKHHLRCDQGLQESAQTLTGVPFTHGQRLIACGAK